MKRNRSQALGFVLDHRKKIIKGVNALLQILEKLPDGASVTDLVAAQKAAAATKAKAKAAKVAAKSKAKTKAKVKKKAKQEKKQPAAASSAPESAPAEDLATVGAS